jgi:hypothetical protein
LRWPAEYVRRELAAKPWIKKIWQRISKSRRASDPWGLPGLVWDWHWYADGGDGKPGTENEIKNQRPHSDNPEYASRKTRSDVDKRPRTNGEWDALQGDPEMYPN